nr:hypothetical protein [Tanacetum cinerariifolium]
MKEKAISICERYSLLEEERHEEEAIIRIKGEALIEKDDPGTFIIPIRLEGDLDVEPLEGRADEAFEQCYVPGGCNHNIAKFIILDIPTDRDTPLLVGRAFLHTCGGILNTIDIITSTFDGICHQTFRAAKTSLDTTESDNDDEEEYAF